MSHRPAAHRPRWATALGTLATAAVIAALGLLAARPAAATEGMMRSARSTYPGIAGTVLDSCALCHNSPGYSVDAYGRAYNQARRDFGAIEGLDSDGDGFSNLAEIQALTFPGKADSHPVGPSPTPTPSPSATATPPPSATPSPTTPAPATATRTATPEPTIDPGKLHFQVYAPFVARNH